ncbi:hypothetical protein [Xanthomonas cannabis]|nr:hypothetical protein [Xanthomonas cannabis]NIK18438.1 hypothetical protein [Xanthomonas cannabis]
MTTGLSAMASACTEVDTIVKVNVAKMQLSNAMRDANSNIFIAL